MTKRDIIHFGPAPLALADLLPADCDYHECPAATTAITVPGHDPVPVFHAHRLIPFLREPLFLISADAFITTEPALLTQLPANHIVADTPTLFAGKAARVMSLKQVLLVDFDDLAALAEHITDDWFASASASGKKFPQDNVAVSPAFQGQVRQTGYAALTLAGRFGTTWQPLVSWPTPVPVAADQNIRFLPEIDCRDGARAQFIIGLRDHETGQLTKTVTLPADQLGTGLIFRVPAQAQDVALQLLATGKGTITLGQMHMNRARRGYGQLQVNDERLVGTEPLNDTLLAYFDAGNLQPPLTVYFCNFNPTEGFSDAALVTEEDRPYLLFTDPRLVGGAFYYGSASLEQRVLAMIRNVLQRLDFGADQLIMAGSAMGATAALYYGAQLTPAGIVVGRPLVNVGSVAENLRIQRPGVFLEAADILQLHSGGTDRTAVQALNQRFWSQFKQAVFHDLTIAVGYMAQDDEDPQAFGQLYADLTGSTQAIQLVHKGFPGRHNDQPDEVAEWLSQEYHAIIQDRFTSAGEEAAEK
ncbi:accessory Sec system protein Asp2 [Schleiferilactobacillus shenzhenensis]|uniref:Accessory Sec system protein Asp2 n=1 Tax=Schleiferilactobacillus shenzhenensis LY-73 TaxID=1231336 RepID=U4TI93_9LACO|nr:accessory Sec system protein Asp2 [Schleiferilactobacillus shenzhenensis]ERL64521.1 hypothetical protein L248_0816 [Schleiferilactobacillus shenzhenensis LY-73]